MKAVIKLDVPDWQIGQDVTVYFPDTMMKRCKCELLKEQEESIPISWLEEKLEGHPELPYAVTDGINNVLDLWEGR